MKERILFIPRPMHRIYRTLIDRQTLLESGLEILGQQGGQFDPQLPPLQKLHQASHAAESLHQLALPRQGWLHLDQADPVEDLEVGLLARPLQKLLHDPPHDPDPVTRHRNILRRVRARAIGRERRGLVPRPVDVRRASLTRDAKHADDGQADGQATAAPIPVARQDERDPCPIHALRALGRCSLPTVYRDDCCGGLETRGWKIVGNLVEPTAEVRVVHLGRFLVSFIYT